LISEFSEKEKGPSEVLVRSDPIISDKIMLTSTTTRIGSGLHIAGFRLYIPTTSLTTT